nr:MAG TPA: hypothetical protein [Caudoviricetes sp.]
MVNLSEYKDYCTSLLKLIGADELVMVVQEEHLKKRLRDETGVIMVAVYPTIGSTGSEDNMGDNNTILLFVLEYAGKTSVSRDNEFESYERLQGLAGKIRDKLIEDSDAGHNLLRNLDRTSIEIEPEWNIAGAYNGWSIAFSFEN